MASRERIGDRGSVDTSGRREECRDYVDIRADFAEVSGSEHMALFYDNRASQLRVAAAFIDTRLRAGEKCLYLADDNDTCRVHETFESVGIDVEGRTAAGDLTILDATEVYLDDGFDPDGMIRTLEEFGAEGIAAGYDGIAVAGENTWSFDSDVSFDDIIDFEAEFDGTDHDVSITTLCQYNLDRFDESAVAKALWTHRYVIYRQRICDNPHYVPPAEYADTENPRLNASLMLEQIYDLSRTRRDIETQAEHLSVLNRVLRHNIGNDLNVVLGRLSLLDESADLDEAEREHLSTAIRVAERVVDRADKARNVREAVTDPQLEPVDVRETVDRAVTSVMETFPEAEVNVTCEDVPDAIADRHIGTAVRELLTNAIVHQEADRPAVDVSVTNPSPTTVSVSVSNDGPPIPANEKRALTGGSEEPLSHGTGLGLWLVKWAVDNSRGELSFPDDDERCRVRLELQTGDSLPDRD